MMAQRRQLDMFTKGRIVGMLESSRSQTEVSRILNVDQSVISRLRQMFRRTRDVTRQSVSGPPRITASRQDRYLVISARRQRGSTVRALDSALTVATGIRILRQTVYRRLNHAGLYARRPAVCIPLTSAHKRVAAVAEWYRYRTVACFVTGSSPVPLKTRRIGQRCTLNLSRAETSSRWCGVVVRRGGCQLRCHPRHLTMVRNYVVRRQKPSCS
ncbi:transposable element Tcb2 transposase [Trichonephila clavipes]|nr:transposable element Tcb2 transposase [Trichonephila clavipes]